MSQTVKNRKYFLWDIKLISTLKTFSHFLYPSIIFTKLLAKQLYTSTKHKSKVTSSFHTVRTIK